MNASFYYARNICNFQQAGKAFIGRAIYLKKMRRNRQQRMNREDLIKGVNQDIIKEARLYWIQRSLKIESLYRFIVYKVLECRKAEIVKTELRINRKKKG